MIHSIRKLGKQLWHDETGAVVSAELALIGTMGVAGAAVGMDSLSKSVNDELFDVASAFRSLDQSFHIAPQRSRFACVAGSHFCQQDVKVSLEELRKHREELEAKHQKLEKKANKNKNRGKKAKEEDGESDAAE